jgi:hypothetical protein
MEQILKDLVRSVEREGQSYVLRYRLCGERTRNGGHFLYVKCYCETWRNARVAEESMALGGGSGLDHRRMLDFFKKVATAPEPVFPCHLQDLLQDEMGLTPPAARIDGACAGATGA